MIRIIREDWKRHKDYSKRALFALWVYRYGRFALTTKPLVIKKLLGLIYCILQPLSELLSGIYLYRDTSVGKNIHFVHPGNIQIHPAAIIGDNVGIMHGVTIGVGNNNEGKLPVIGNGVFLGTNCTILGNVKIGDGATVAANSLVIMDIPDNCMAIGVPAKIMPKLGL